MQTACCQNVKCKKITNLSRVVKNTYVNQNVYALIFCTPVEKTVESVENSRPAHPFSVFFGVGSQMRRLHIRLHNRKISQVLRYYVSVLTTCFSRLNFAKKLPKFFEIKKIPPPLSLRQKFLVIFHKKHFGYENRPTGNTGYIFIFRRMLCRGK